MLGLVSIIILSVPAPGTAPRTVWAVGLHRRCRTNNRSPPSAAAGSAARRDAPWQPNPAPRSRRSSPTPPTTRRLDGLGAAGTRLAHILLACSSVTPLTRARRPAADLRRRGAG